MQERNEVSVLCRSFPAKICFWSALHCFPCFWCRQSDLPAASGRTGRYQPLACLCGPCRQRRRPAHCGRGGCGTGRRSGQACRPGASGVRHGVHNFSVSFHRPVPCHPRTASTSFQMLVPLIGGGTGLQLAYSVLFLQRPFWWRCGRKSLPTGWAASSAPV